MSTTAGLGSGDYVAVNPTAVFALILGFFSFLAFFSEMLLIVPLACAVASVLAFRQIRRSNGTQTGVWLVVIGLLVALACGGSVFVRSATEGIRTRADRQAFGQLKDDLTRKIQSGDFPAVYALFSDRFHQHYAEQAFSDRFKLIIKYYGPLKSIGWNGLAEFVPDETTGTQYAAISFEFNFEKNPLRDTATLRKENAKLRNENDRWVIESLPDLFPPPQPQRGR
jgi:hypothetical protein